MNNKLKIIFGYILLFLESIILFTITTLVVYRLTLFDKSYIKKELSKNDYYKKMNEEIKTEMSFYTEQSGFEDSVLDDIFTLTDIRNTTNSFITNIYNGQVYNISTNIIEEKLNKNINNYIQKENFKVVNQDEINKFTKQISKVYSDEIKLMGYLDKVCKYIPKVKGLIEYAVVGLFALLVALIIINEKAFKRRDYSVVLFTSAFLIICTLIFFTDRIDVKNLLVYSKTVSGLVISIIHNLSLFFILIAILYIIIGIVIILLKKEKKHSHRHSHKHSHERVN